MKNAADKALGAVLVALIAGALVGGVLQAMQGAGGGEAGNLLRVGTPAPSFLAMRHADKKPISSADVAGKVLVLDFWGTWCPPCREEAPVVRELALAYAADNVVVLAMDDEQGADDPEKLVDAFLERANLKGYPVAYPDSTMIAKYQVRVFPTLYVIGRDGKVRFRAVGEVGADELRREIDAALKG